MNHRELRRSTIFLALILVSLTACGAPAPTSTPRPAQEVAQAPTLAPSPTPTLAPTLAPSPMPTLAPTATPLPPVGHVIGRITGADSGRPQTDLQVILCLLPSASEGEDESCQLQATPTSQSGADGTFELQGVLAGSYVLVHGNPNDDVAPVDDWAGLDVTPGRLCVVSLTGKRYVCKSEEVAFWAEGGDVLSGTERLTIGDDGRVSFFGVAEGLVRSDSLGISVMIQDTKLAPVLKVRAGETTVVEWKLLGR